MLKNVVILENNAREVPVLTSGHDKHRLSVFDEKNGWQKNETIYINAQEKANSRNREKNLAGPYPLLVQSKESMTDELTADYLRRVIGNF